MQRHVKYLQSLQTIIRDIIFANHHYLFTLYIYMITKFSLSIKCDINVLPQLILQKFKKI
jgi:hypothetical protein